MVGDFVIIAVLPEKIIRKLKSFVARSNSIDFKVLLCLLCKWFKMSMKLCLCRAVRG